MTVETGLNVFRDLGAVGVLCISFIWVLRHLVMQQSEQLSKLTDGFTDYCDRQKKSMDRLVSSMAFLARSVIGLEEVVIHSSDFVRSIEEAKRNGKTASDIDRMRQEALIRVEKILERQTVDLNRFIEEVKNK